MVQITQVIPVILAGGAGSRLVSEISDLPKPLAPVSGRPFITYLFDQLLNAGFKQIIIATGYLGEKFPEILGHSYDSLKLIYSQEIEPLGTGGAIRLAMKLAPDACRQFLVMNGDSLVDLEIVDFVCWGQEYSASMVVVSVDDSSRYGAVVMDENSRVLQFWEKFLNYRPSWINAGIYLLSEQVLKAWPVGKRFSFESSSLPMLTANGELYGFQVAASFIDIGIPETYRRAGKFVADYKGAKNCSRIGALVQ